MTEVYYLPLKSPNGAIVGHARIAGGMARLQLKRPVHGQAVVLSEDGTWFGDTEEELCVRGKLCAIAVLEEGRILCCGIPREQNISFSELQRQLERPSVPVRTAHTAFDAAMPTESVPAPPPPQVEPTPTTVCSAECPAEGAKPHTLRIPKHAIRKRTRTRAAQAIPMDAPCTTAVFTPIRQDFTAAVPDPVPTFAGPDAVLPSSEPSEPHCEDLLLFDARDGLPAPSLADSAADSEAFAALLRRAELVFESIEAPHPPLVSESKRTAARAYAAEFPADTPASHGLHTPAGTAAQRSWGQEVELLLGERPAQSRTATENPFPHIFPNAVFYRVGGSGVQAHLEGEWLSGGERMHIYAMPGSYSPQPPAHLKGYTRFIRTQQGSYWVRVTGEG